MNVEIKIDGKSLKVPKGSILKEFMNMNFPCGGHGKCGKCKVILNGNIPYSADELRLLSETEIKNNVHLACLTKVQNEMEVFSVSTHTNLKDKIISDGFMPNFVCKPSFSKLGIAIDIGTTTVAAKVYNRKGVVVAEGSMLNPQSEWGADVVSRVEASLAGNSEKITKSVIQAIDDLIFKITSDRQLSAADIGECVITGNTVMLSLLTATPVTPFSRAPFVCERLFGENISAQQMGFHSLSSDTNIYLPHCASAFVGADTVTALLASDIFKSKKTQLLVDIGTNGEMALWHREKLYLCSTAAGPAFEGVGISMGMPCKSGAIDRVEIVRDKLSAHVVDDITPRGICGSGIIDALSCLLKMGIIDETGYMEKPTTLLPPVVIESDDVRAVQLSKSAICSGILTLLKHANISCESVEKVYLAGGFGSCIDIKNACFIGLLPLEFKSKIKTIGNAALSGASMMLLNEDYRKSAADFIKNSSVIELQSDAFFIDSYINNMMFYPENKIQEL